MTGRKKRCLTIRDNETEGDLAAWKRAGSGDNAEQLARLTRNLRKVRSCELTPRQAEVIHLYYDMGINIPEIARREGVCTSTVSRILSRGRKRLRHYLQYSL